MEAPSSESLQTTLQHIQGLINRIQTNDQDYTLEELATLRDLARETNTVLLSMRETLEETQLKAFNRLSWMERFLTESEIKIENQIKTLRKEFAAVLMDFNLDVRFSQCLGLHNYEQVLKSIDNYTQKDWTIVYSHMWRLYKAAGIKVRVNTFTMKHTVDTKVKQFTVNWESSKSTEAAKNDIDVEVFGKEFGVHTVTGAELDELSCSDESIGYWNDDILEQDIDENCDTLPRNGGRIAHKVKKLGRRSTNNNSFKDKGAYITATIKAHKPKKIVARPLTNPQTDNGLLTKVISMPKTHTWTAGDITKEIQRKINADEFESVGIMYRTAQDLLIDTESKEKSSQWVENSTGGICARPVKDFTVVKNSYQSGARLPDTRGIEMVHPSKMNRVNKLVSLKKRVSKDFPDDSRILHQFIDKLTDEELQKGLSDKNVYNTMCLRGLGLIKNLHVIEPSINGPQGTSRGTCYLARLVTSTSYASALMGPAPLEDCPVCLESKPLIQLHPSHFAMSRHKLCSNCCAQLFLRDTYSRPRCPLCRSPLSGPNVLLTSNFFNDPHSNEFIHYVRCTGATGSFCVVVKMNGVVVSDHAQEESVATFLDQYKLYIPPTNGFYLSLEHYLSNLVTLGIAYDHEISSALNGNNGEWTNADDLAMAARNYTACSNRIASRNGRRNLVAAPIDYSTSSPLSLYELTHYVVPFQFGGVWYAWNGRNVLSEATNNQLIGGVKFIDPDTGEGWDIGYEGDAVRSKEAGFGFAITYTLLKDSSGTDLPELLTIPGQDTYMTSAIGEIPEAYRGPGVDVLQPVYFIPLFRDLRKKFPSIKFGEQVRKGMASYCNSYMVDLDPLLVSQTLKYCWESMVTNGIRNTGAVDIARMNQDEMKKILVEEDYVTATNLLKYNHLVDYGSYVAADAVTCQLPLNFVMRPDCQFVRHTLFEDHSNLQPDPNNFGIESEFVVPEFVTMLNAGAPKWKDEQYQRFHASNMARFLCYDNNGTNTCLAAQRMCKSRENEEQYMQNQFNVWSLMKDKLLYRRRQGGYSDTIRKLEDTFRCYVRDVPVMIDGKEVHRHAQWFGNSSLPNKPPKQLTHSIPNGDGTFTNWDDDSDGAHFIANEMNRLIYQSTRSKIDFLKDSFNNMAMWAYYGIYQSYTETMWTEYGRSRCADEIHHLKMKLRKCYVKGQLIHLDEVNMVKRLNATVKRELAKCGKVPRFFVTYEAGCMYANDIPEYFKMALTGEHTIAQEHTQYGFVRMTIKHCAKREEYDLENAFASLIAATREDNSIYSVVFSDDMCIAGKVGGHPFCFNGDISGCDASNRHMIFGTLGLAMSNFHAARAVGLVSQCCGLIRMTNPSNKEERVDLDIHGPFEGSGSVLTSALNFVASHAILSGFLYDLTHTTFEDFDPAASFQRGAKLSGHKVTAGDCYLDGSFQPELIQFLKYSPMLTVEGKYIPVKNVGCLLRSWGLVQNGLSAKSLNISEAAFLAMTHAERFDLHACNVIRSLSNEANCAVYSTFRERYLCKQGEQTSVDVNAMDHDPQNDLKFAAGNYSQHNIDVKSFCNRYQLTNDELNELTEVIRTIRIGAAVQLTALSKIFKIDYDLAPVEDQTK
jgi:hypothetical protein